MLRQQELHDEVLRVQERLLRIRHGDIPVAFLMSTIRRQLASCVHGLAPLLEEIMQRGLAALELPDTDLPNGAPTHRIHPGGNREARGASARAAGERPKSRAVT